MAQLSLDSAIRTFVSSREKGLQLDLFRNNGQVLLQLFKGYDVVNWGIGFVPRGDDLVMMLHFKKHKTDNDLNYQRFLGSNIFARFQRVQVQGEEMYYSKSSTTEDAAILELEVREIIEKVYQFGTEKVTFSLKAY